MKQVAHGLVVLVAVLLGCAASAPDTSQAPQTQAAVQPAGPPHTIQIDLEEKGTCVKAQVLRPTYTVQDVVLQWRVTNGCSSPQTVQVTNWRVKGTSAQEWPFNQPAGPKDCTAQANGGTCMITLTVRKTRADGEIGAWVYVYDMLLNGNKVDPEMIIEWF